MRETTSPVAHAGVHSRKNFKTHSLASSCPAKLVASYVVEAPDPACLGSETRFCTEL